MKILFIRGGAIGDFIITFPALEMLRAQWPDAHIEILGQASTTRLALHRRYAQAVRSVDQGGLALFFARRSSLNPEMISWFGEFDLVVSCFYDPDEIFLENLEACGLTRWEKGDGLPPYSDNGRVLPIDPRVTSATPAAKHFCDPLVELGLPEPASYVSHAHFLEEDFHAADEILKSYDSKKLVLCHPGSGSLKKNWPLKKWAAFLDAFSSEMNLTPLILTGPAELEHLGPDSPLMGDFPRLENLGLPTVAALLSRVGVYIGHDTGISHLAAAAGARCLLLFGCTDPAIWAPPGMNVRILHHPPSLEDLPVDAVHLAAGQLLE